MRTRDLLAAGFKDITSLYLFILAPLFSQNAKWFVNDWHEKEGASDWLINTHSGVEADGDGFVAVSR